GRSSYVDRSLCACSASFGASAPRRHSICLACHTQANPFSQKSLREGRIRRWKGDLLKQTPSPGDVSFGSKQTFATHKTMSALPPIADKKFPTNPPRNVSGQLLERFRCLLWANSRHRDPSGKFVSVN